ncbi:putative magnesium or manganese-dependent protein phosphatase [Streptomyces ambofaciens ATCC 23877]|uniref:Putative magnesium or manganese-dependent protein phosphatase n=1 Tax=Streptomyces ambofaciens (strain ATCC 23877 / 3486 / DSM 40053 / JCM 4204 / NBRC 12836 / NRRL B-2516) TaxID=278992 RepID=A0ACF1_STRA7|nr:SpoIIE family protein phosphatase [Streptomyces ambofaciens]AKZ60191.1 putative magnesium or manganese-dependent protein phosphatase [Streptomyces ambofaciens ATCC 23877]CAJ88155.1 putative magnesium or manganese-dependent protein phosphatase [Streptomyces ambofaciens ATCC 23877]
MCRTDQQPDPYEPDNDGDASGAVFASLLEDSAEELYESAPCGYLSTLMDGIIAKINSTLLDWLGLEREQVVGRMRFTDLLTVGGKLYHETHFAPLLRMQGEISGVALELKQTGGGRIPVFVSSAVKYGSTGEPLLIRTTVFDARDRRAYEEELLRARKAAEEAHKEAEADRARLQDALAVLQQSLLPATLPAVPGVEAAAHYRTASPDRLGGDFYDLFPLDGKRFAFFLGDVCGKGPQAAAVTSLTRYTLRAAALHDPDPVAALTTLNQVLHERYTGGDPRYCTVIFGVLEPDPATGQVSVHVASGGHPPALVLRADGTADFLPTPGGLLVGVLPAATFVTATSVLGPGDSLVLYTDGLTEARTSEDRDSLYGDEALLDFAAGHAGKSPQAVIQALTGLLDGFGDGLDDDTALLALGVPAPAPATRVTE